MEQKIQHPEWEHENSLTCPADRDRENKWKPSDAPPLTNEETKIAMKALINTDFMDRFPCIERKYADPVMPMQYIGLFSFTPAKGATPNENGVYGFAKLRGNFPDEISASERAAELIQTVDSYHQIYYPYIGRPFPITSSSKYSAQVDEIELKKELVKDVSHNIKSKKADDQQRMKEIEAQQEELLEESKREVDDYDTYITLRIKKAQLSFTYLEHMKKLEEVKGIIIKTRKEVEELDKLYPEYKREYYKKYMGAREKAGLKTYKRTKKVIDGEVKEDLRIVNEGESEDSKEGEEEYTIDEALSKDDAFLKFLVEDVPLPGIDSIPDVILEEDE